MSRTFTVRGSRNGSKVHLSWTDGRLGGDPPTVDLVTVEAELVALNPTGRHTWARLAVGGDLVDDPLADPSATWLLIKSVFDSISEVDGDPPPEAFEEVRRAAGRGTDNGSSAPGPSR